MPQLYYGAPVWAPFTASRKHFCLLDKVIRKTGLLITRCFRTTYPAVFKLSGLRPAHFDAAKLVLEEEFRRMTKTSAAWHNPLERKMNTSSFETDFRSEARRLMQRSQHKHFLEISSLVNHAFPPWETGVLINLNGSDDRMASTSIWIGARVVNETFCMGCKARSPVTVGAGSDVLRWASWADRTSAILIALDKATSLGKEKIFALQITSPRVVIYCQSSRIGQYLDQLSGVSPVIV